jgi:tetratricopeptide (TPR) repeat protein
VLPLVWAGHLLLVERRPLRSAAAPWLLAGWAAVLALYLAARAAVLPDRLGASGVSAGALSNVAVFASSLGKLVLPVDLSVMATQQDSRIWPGVVAAGAVLAVCLVPGIRRARVLFALAAFVAFVAPGLPASRMLVLENRLALPAIPILIIACEVAHRISWPGRTGLAIGGALVAALAAATASYSGDFRDRLSFAQAAARRSPHAALVRRNLGVAYHLAGQYGLARQEYQAAVAADAAEPIVHNNLAVLLMAEGRLPEAEAELRAELAVNPDYAAAHDNLARVLGALGRSDEAAKEQAIAAQLARRE